MMKFRAASNEWFRLLYSIVYFGEDCFPRGKHTRELTGLCSEIDMAFPIVCEPKRKLGYKFQAAEAAWILTGNDQVASIAPFSKKIVDFSDDGVTFFGAYGPRILEQIFYVVDKFLEDPNTRQAVITTWRINPPRSKDIPCTVSLQWLYRGRKLHCIANMRSSDAWLGWPYDVFNFSMISGYLALLLRSSGFNQPIEMGSLKLFAGSQHLYCENLATSREIVLEDTDRPIPHCPEFKPLEQFTDCTELQLFLWHAAKGEGSLEAFRSLK